MSYYTHFELNWEDQGYVPDNSLYDLIESKMGDEAKEVLDKLPARRTVEDDIADYISDKTIGDGEMTYALTPTGGCRNSTARWYQWKNDMILMSLVIKNVLFILKGEGEESTDLWRAYFKNGKMQVENAQIVYGEYDPEKMK